MDRQQRIHEFSLSAHRLALERLREQPIRLRKAEQVLQRWRRQAGNESHCDPYWNEWERLLKQGVDAIEAAVCASDDHAATLRSVSPLGRFISVAERYRLLSEARAQS